MIDLVVLVSGSGTNLQAVLDAIAEKRLAARVKLVISNVAGVNLQAWQPQDEKADTFYSKVPMKIELTGRFFQVAKFAYEVGKLERIINIENIELTDPKIEGDEIHVKARCLATTFHTPSAATSAAPASTTGAPATTSTATPPGGK